MLIYKPRVRIWQSNTPILIILYFPFFYPIKIMPMSIYKFNKKFYKTN